MNTNQTQTIPAGLDFMGPRRKFYADTGTPYLQLTGSLRNANAMREDFWDSRLYESHGQLDAPEQIQTGSSRTCDIAHFCTQITTTPRD